MVLPAWPAFLPSPSPSPGLPRSPASFPVAPQQESPSRPRHEAAPGVGRGNSDLPAVTSVVMMIR